MYRTGHYGVALLLYAPVGGVVAIAGRPGVAIAGGAGVLALTPIPDWDHRVPGLTHRGVTHTVAFACLLGGLLAGATLLVEAVPERTALALFAFGVGAFAVLAHLAADALTPAGVRPLWPLSGRHVSVGLTTADSVVWNYLLLAIGVLATAVTALLTLPTVV